MASVALVQRELVPLVSRSVGRETLAKALQLYVGYRGGKRRFTMEQLEEGSGVNRRVIQCVMEEADSPEYRKIEAGDLLSLASFLGTPFTSALLRPCDQGTFDLMDQPPLDGVLTSGPTPVVETPKEKVARLSRELAAAVEELV